MTIQHTKAGVCHLHSKSGQKEPPKVRGLVQTGNTPCPKCCGKEELPHVQGQGQQPRVAQERPRGSTPLSEVRGGDDRRYPTSLSPRPQEVAGRTNPCPRSHGCAGAGGPRGAIPCERSGRAAVRRSPSSKVSCNGCTLLEQP